MTKETPSADEACVIHVKAPKQASTSDTWVASVLSTPVFQGQEWTVKIKNKTVPCVSV